MPRLSSKVKCRHCGSHWHISVQLGKLGSMQRMRRCGGPIATARDKDFSKWTPLRDRCLANWMLHSHGHLLDIRSCEPNMRGHPGRAWQTPNQQKFTRQHPPQSYVSNAGCESRKVDGAALGDAVRLDVGCACGVEEASPAVPTCLLLLCVHELLSWISCVFASPSTS